MGPAGRFEIQSIKKRTVVCQRRHAVHQKRKRARPITTALRQKNVTPAQLHGLLSSTRKQANSSLGAQVPRRSVPESRWRRGHDWACDTLRFRCSSEFIKAFGMSLAETGDACFDPGFRPDKERPQMRGQEKSRRLPGPSML